MAIFIFTIAARTLKSGESPTQERLYVVEMMQLQYSKSATVRVP
jgi:hypothetical protein